MYEKDLSSQIPEVGTTKLKLSEEGSQDPKHVMAKYPET